ncbi:dihydroxyacetone kinase subunit DhaL [Tropicimonas isoalkanivorans]|uniref:Dihydroxyacetone kinase, C-terminal domain n=1 Tax=Tropicimonas isoalkanivorans TaxID=441112 RepID=A0A1I1MJX7_9RHOB|nr:dihydroxyacetone kinase subunit DhaL [Tropicimonas isoalkanivorans]SFC85691.1 dihydroxyacetone kinase, C-terminal domain [Tropicimonas isoalkanivorans]
MQAIDNKGAGAIVSEIATAIVDNKAYLSEIDGKIGDGDHGVNMAKGFGRAADRLDPAGTLDEAMQVLSDVLMSEIGGSMGPLYGMMFSDMADSIEGAEQIDAEAFGKMIRAGLEGVQDIGSAKVGDKTLLDAFSPAVETFDAATAEGKSFAEALQAMKAAAAEGRDSTIDMVAKVGRSSRLGERSRGVLDAGATSCAMILGCFADSIGNRLA